MTSPRSPSCSTSWRRIAWGIVGVLPLAVAIAIAIPVARAALVAGLPRVADVRQQRQLTRALHGRGDLVLMTPARTGDAARADLAPVRDELAERVDVLVVDELDLVAAVLAGLTTAAAGSAFAITPARRPAALLCHVRKPLLATRSLDRCRARRQRRPPDRVAERGRRPRCGGAAVCRLERDVVVAGGGGAARGRCAGGLEVTRVGRNVGPCGEAVAPAAAHAVLAAAQELDRVGDDLDGLALASALGLPLAPLEATVDRHRTTL